MTKKKDSGIEWIGEIPQYWFVKPLYSIGNQVRTKNTAGKKANLLSLSYGEIKEKDIDSTDGLLPESFDTYQEIKPGDLVFRFTDLQNDKRSLRSAVSRFDGIITSAYLGFRPKSVDSKYLGYLMRFYDNTKVFYSMGSGLRQSLKYSDVRRMAIIVPPLEEQKTIADFLDDRLLKIDLLIEKEKTLIKLSSERRIAEISALVRQGHRKPVASNWTSFRLKDVATIFSSNVDKKTYDDGVPVKLCNYVDVYYNDRISGELEFMEATASLGELKKFQLRAGWVIATKDSESADDIGIAAYVEKDLPGVVCGYHLAILQPSEKLDGLFLKYFLDSSDTKMQLAQRATGLTRVGLGKGDFGSLAITLPPLDEQEFIAAKITETCEYLDSLIAASKDLIAKLEERRKALIGAAVTGKIDVRGKS